MMIKFDKIVLVTGGVRGIGDAICRKFLESGSYFVIAFDVDAERNKIWQETLAQAGYQNTAVYVVDVSDFNVCQKAITEIKNEHGRIDVLVNNAGIARDKTLKKMTKEDWDAVLRIDLDSVFNVTCPVLDIMLEHNFGRIISISSVNALKGQFGQCNYSAAKSGMYGFTKSLALETARKNITVNTVSPGYIATDMMKNIPEDILKDIITQIPVGRLGKPEEVAEVVAFLASEKAGYITGTNVSINGGLYM